LWNYADLAAVVTAGLLAVFRMTVNTGVSSSLTKQTVADAFNNPSQSYFRELAYAYMKCELCVALLVFFAWIKVWSLDVEFGEFV